VRASLAGYLAPGFALLGSAFLGQPLTAREIAGLVLVLAGSYLAAGRERAAADRGNQEHEGASGMLAPPRSPGEAPGAFDPPGHSSPAHGGKQPEALRLPCAYQRDAPVPARARTGASSCPARPCVQAPETPDPACCEQPRWL
jgi:hypothetical protein